MSAISQISISRPVLAGVMSVLLILFGIVGYTYLGTREYPVTESPTVMVTTVYPGRGAQCAFAAEHGGAGTPARPECRRGTALQLGLPLVCIALQLQALLLEVHTVSLHLLQ